MAPLFSLSSFAPIQISKENDRESSTSPFPLLTPHIFPFPSPTKASSSNASNALDSHHRTSVAETVLSQKFSNKNTLYHDIKDSVSIDHLRNSFDVYDAIAHSQAVPPSMHLRRASTPSSISAHSSPSTHSFISSRPYTMSRNHTVSRFPPSTPPPKSVLRASHSAHSISPSIRNRHASPSRRASPVSQTSVSTCLTPRRETSDAPRPTDLSYSPRRHSQPSAFHFDDGMHYRAYFGSPPPALGYPRHQYKTPHIAEDLMGPVPRPLDHEAMDLQRLLLLHQYRANQFELQLEECKSTLEGVLNADSPPSNAQYQALELLHRLPIFTVAPRARTVLLREQVNNLQQQVHWLQSALAGYHAHPAPDTSGASSSPSSSTIQEVYEDVGLPALTDGTTSEDESCKSPPTVRQDDVSTNVMVNEMHFSPETPVAGYPETSLPSDSQTAEPHNAAEVPGSCLTVDTLRQQVNYLERELANVVSTSRQSEYFLRIELAEMHRQRELHLFQLDDLEKQLHDIQRNIFGSSHDEYEAKCNLSRSSSRQSHARATHDHTSLPTPSVQKNAQATSSPTTITSRSKHRRRVLSTFDINELLLRQKYSQMKQRGSSSRNLNRKLRQKSILCDRLKSKYDDACSALTKKETLIQQLATRNEGLMKDATLQKSAPTVQVPEKLAPAPQREEVNANSNSNLANMNVELESKLTNFQKEKLLLKSELLQLEQLLDDMRIQHDHLVKELNKSRSQLTTITEENKQLKENEKLLAEVPVNNQADEFAEALNFKSLLSTLLHGEDAEQSWRALGTDLHRLQGLIQLMTSLEVQITSRPSSPLDGYKNAMIPQAEHAVAKMQNFIKLLGRWEAQTRTFMEHVSIPTDVSPGSAPHKYLQTLEEWFETQKLSKEKSEKAEAEGQENTALTELDTNVLKSLFMQLPAQQVQEVWKVLAKYPNVLSQLYQVNNILSNLQCYVGGESMDELELQIKTRLPQLNQLHSLADLFELSVHSVGDALTNFFKNSLANLKHTSHLVSDLYQFESLIATLCTRQKDLEQIYTCQKKYLKVKENLDEPELQARVLESISLNAKLKQQLKVIYVKWKQTQEQLKKAQLPLADKDVPSFASLQIAWREVVNGVGCRLTEDPEVVAKSLVQNMYNANSNVLQLSEEINQANRKCDQIEESFQQFKKQCKTVLNIPSDSESSILQAMVTLQNDVHLKTWVDPNEYRALKNAWDTVIQGVAHVLQEEPIDVTFSLDDQCRYWMHSLHCFAKSKHQDQLKYSILKVLHQRLRPKIECLGQTLNLNDANAKNMTVILDEAAHFLWALQDLQKRVHFLYTLVLPDTSNSDLTTKLDALEQYLKEHRHYRERYYQRRGSSNSHSICIPNLKALIGSVATMPLVLASETRPGGKQLPVHPNPTSLEKILNETLGQTETTLAKYFEQLTKAEEKVLHCFQESSPVPKTNLSSGDKPHNSTGTLTAVDATQELQYALETMLNMKTVTLENFERQKLLLSAKLKDYLKTMTEAQSQAFVQLQANHEAELHKLKLESGTHLSEKERDLRRFKKETILLKNQLQGLLAGKETQAYSKALSVVLSKTLQTLDKI